MKVSFKLRSIPLFAAICFFSLISNSAAQPSSSPGTLFGRGTGEYGAMLENLKNDMLTDVEMRTKKLDGKERTVFVHWIRDNIHVMKAMKYLHPDISSLLEYYLENQTAEGMYFDYYFPLGVKGISDRMNLFDKRYWKVIKGDSVQLHRLPVEADLEYLMVEGVYDVWQATSDTAFIKQWLPTLVKGMHYAMTDPLRWSKKYQLVKRGYTLDTWDFMQLPTSREEYTKNGGNVQKGIFNIDSLTPMGIMHGDNSGMYAAASQLSRMYKAVGDNSAAMRWDTTAQGFRNRTNNIAWNGKYYAHFVEDDPMPAYLTMDQKNTLSLSNPYDINRGLPTPEMAQSIIQTYQQLKESNKDNSFAEWYGVYPAVQPHFADYQPGSYMNGGVNTIVAGELAKAAFQNGFEKYGVDILDRLNDLIKKYNGKFPVAYTPQGEVDAGIPDNWGQAAVYSAMIEGLAGVTDRGTLLKQVEISPRWLAAGKDTANVTVSYPPSGAFLAYRYLHDPVARTITLRITGDIDQGTANFLLPENVKFNVATINRKVHTASTFKVRESSYVSVSGWSGKNETIVVKYR